MIPGLKSLATDLEKLKEQLPQTPSPGDRETRAWLAGLTRAEKDRGAEILIRAGNGQEPSAADIFSLEELAARQPVQLPEIDPSQPVCFACGQQPAWERGNPPSQPVCESCYRCMCGRAYDHEL